MTPRERTDWVKALATAGGFARVGVAAAGPLPHMDGLDRWLSAGMHAGMAYMARNIELRKDPAAIVPGARSVICLVVPYAPARDVEAGPGQGVIARYARGRDYHKVLKSRCHALMDTIRREEPAFDGRAFVDSAPLAERTLAVLAGLGSVGRNGCLIVPGLGSYVLLSEIVCNLELVPDSPQAGPCDGCGRCVSACPTGALTGDGLVDSRRCISYWTLEDAGEVPDFVAQGMGARVLGCDACQEACPHNVALPAGDDEITGGASPLSVLDLAQVLAWTTAQWDQASRGRAWRRADEHMVLRNALIAAGNSRMNRKTGHRV